MATNQQGMLPQLAKRGGPYASNTAGMGGLPTVGTDVPICAVFIFLYLCFAFTNIFKFQANQRKHHKFLLLILLIGFSWARVATLVLRIAWATRPKNIRLALAAQIFLNAGVLIIYILNLVLAQRILRAKQPQLGWNPILRLVFKILYILIVLALAGVISAVVITQYTLNPHTRSICRDLQLAALTYLLFFTCLPVPHLAAAVLLPKSRNEESFGTGSMRSKIIIVTISTVFCMIIAGFKAGVSWSPVRLATNPAWYDSKACLYTFDFMLEIFTLAILTFTRIDQRFFIPNGSKQPGDYTRLADSRAREVEDEKTSEAGAESKGSFAT